MGFFYNIHGFKKIFFLKQEKEGFWLHDILHIFLIVALICRAKRYSYYSGMNINFRIVIVHYNVAKKICFHVKGFYI